MLALVFCWRMKNPILSLNLKMYLKLSSLFTVSLVHQFLHCLRDNNGWLIVNWLIFIPINVSLSSVYVSPVYTSPLTHCLNIGLLRNYWLTVLTTDSLCHYWLTVLTTDSLFSLLTHCVTNDSLFQYWLTVSLLTHCLTSPTFSLTCWLADSKI